MTRATKAVKARNTIRELMARGFTDAAELIGAAAEALGGEPSDNLIAVMVWREHFCVTEAN